jgi:hypothetical protein
MEGAGHLLPLAFGVPPLEDHIELAYYHLLTEEFGAADHREVVPEHRESGQAVRPLVNWRMEDVWLDEYLPRKYKWPKRFDAL